MLGWWAWGLGTYNEHDSPGWAVVLGRAHMHRDLGSSSEPGKKERKKAEHTRGLVLLQARGVGTGHQGPNAQARRLKRDRLSDLCSQGTFSP